MHLKEYALILCIKGSNDMGLGEPGRDSFCFFFRIDVTIAYFQYIGSCTHEIDVYKIKQRHSDYDSVYPTKNSLKIA